MLRLAIIDDNSRYTHYLGSAIFEIVSKKSDSFACIYLPKSNLFGKFSIEQTNLPCSKKIWTSFKYPWQIAENIFRDQINSVHIQLEVNTFGHPTTLFLFPLLLVLLRVNKISTTVTIHAVIPRKVKTMASQLLMAMPLMVFYKVIEKISTKIIVHSDVFKEWLKDYGLNDKKITVIHHGILKGPVVMPNVVRKKEKVILCFGVLSPRKGLEHLIRSFKIVNKKFPETKLIIAGFEPTYFHGYRKKLTTLGESLGLKENISFLGGVSEESIEKIFYIADIVVLPYSYSISASGPLTIALQYAKPIIATDTAFFRSELKSEENCLLVKANDVKSLASATILLLENKKTRDKISCGAAKLARNYSWEKVAAQTIQLYEG